ncbi:Rne/Rng family ribonuclease [Aneurinibacillus uraniidurans]|uniref:Rne/Rng family ribonuclease n=1 Tax=Aneurinibacillus uraniidurans TaxID=2966586 RepID=UPI00234B58E2|nr:Rne/Rng family ribonuclease [Aneurinibacillus sp. B1]WCN38568.1 Rne/Rng family ribonuclease [Aneurinibacillus sp. B1]
MRRIVVNGVGRETRVAILEGNRLMEYYMERPEADRIVGNIYRGRVENVLPGMQAAFVDIGTGKNAFLYIDDCLSPGEEGKNKPAINQVVTQGQEIVVQVSKEPFGTKGARVTKQVSLPGRYGVFMPEVDYIGVSRRIQQESERTRLRNIAAAALQPGEGAIIRTLADGASQEELTADLAFLRARWQRAWNEMKERKSPVLVHRDMDLISRVARDMLSEDVEELVVDSRACYQEIRELLAHYRPSLTDRVKLHSGPADLFVHYGVESEIEKALRRKVWLKNGGYLVIDQTEAMTVFDVNTGKFTGNHDLEETVVKTNVEACREIARQLRLRRIGGIIIIDFIDMKQDEHRARVLEAMSQELRKDRTKTHLLGFTKLGLLEMTRKKEHQTLSDTLLRSCPSCEGRGHILSEETLLGELERELIAHGRDDRHEYAAVEVHPHLLAFFERHQEELTQASGLDVRWQSNEALDQKSYRITQLGSK